MKIHTFILSTIIASITAASADIVSLVSPASSSPSTSGSSATITVSSTEVVEFHGYLGTGNSSAAILFTVGGKSFPAALFEVTGQHMSGPLTFNLFSSTTAFGGILYYRIVPATAYAKLDAKPTGKEAFMAAAKLPKRVAPPMALPAEALPKETAAR